jgi:hypothetical protein
VYLLFLVSLVTLGLLPAAAGPLTVSSYSMLNGQPGEYDYSDFTYSNCAGVCDTALAPLSGGTGKLTDGFSPPLSWYAYGDPNPWVGWYTIDPTITFNFASTVTVRSVTVWVDNALGYGTVNLPASVSVDGINYVIPPDNSNPDPRGYTLSGLDITGQSFAVQFFRDPGSYVMVGEVSFDDSNLPGLTASNVPEPATWLLMGGGLGLALLRRRLSSYPQFPR